MKSCAGEEASEPRIKLEKEGYMLQGVGAEMTHKQICLLASLQVFGEQDLFLEPCVGGVDLEIYTLTLLLPYLGWQVTIGGLLLPLTLLISYLAWEVTIGGLQLPLTLLLPQVCLLASLQVIGGEDLFQ
jgi:hypothetical protein